MIVQFRQGVVSYPLGFLQRTGTPVGSRVGLNITTDRPLILQFAHREANYAVVVKQSVGITPPIGAFGPMLSGIDYFLYADLNLTTGILSWGNTTLTPINQATTPQVTQLVDDDGTTNSAVIAGRHWYKTASSNPTDDLANPPFVMWVRNLANTEWVETVRVFLGKYEEASFFVSVSVNASNPNPAIKFSGTQIGNTTENAAGFLVYNSNNTAFKNSDGTFVTTEDILKSGMLLGADLKVGNDVVSARAGATLVGYTVVRFDAFGSVVPVNLFNLDQSFFGFVEQSAALGELVQVIFGGIVTNGLWTWSAANVPIYADNFGQLTETRPSINDARPVAYALSETQIVLGSSRIEVGLVDHATDTVFGAVKLDVAPVAVPGYLDVVYSPLVGVTPGGTLGSSTALAVTNTYTAELVIDGIIRNIVFAPVNMPNFPLTTVPTIGDLVTFLNTFTPAGGGLSGVATASLNSTTTFRITSDTAGPLSTVRLTSGSAALPNLDLFESVAGYLTVDVPVDGSYDSIAASGPAFAAHVADTTVHLSTEQNDLLDLLDAAVPGIVVKDAEGSMASRSVATAGSGRITVVDGDGVAGDPTVDLALVADSGSGTFLKLVRDTWGRVSGTTPVVLADITALADATYVNVSGDTMTGVLVLAAGAAGAPALSFTSDLTKGMYDSGAGEISFAIGGLQKVAIHAGGITTFSGYETATPGMALWNLADPTTGVSFPAPGVMTIMVGGAPVATFGGPPGPLTALVAGDIGTTVQAWDADLDALAGLTSAADKGIQFTGLGTAATFDLTAAGKALLDDVDTTAQRVTLGLVIGTNVQAWDADLDAVALIAVGDGFIQRTAGSWAAAALTGGQVNTALGYTAANAATLSSHTGDATIHFTEGSISHLNITNIGTNSHAAIDTHIADATLHFTVASIDHTAILSVGTNSHAAIDTHIADATLHFTQGAISITASQVSDFTTASQAVPLPRTTQVAPYAITATNEVVLMTGTGNATLPAPVDGKQVVVKNIGVGVVTVIPNAAETIDGAATFGLPTQYDAVTVVSDGTDWFVI